VDYTPLLDAIRERSRQSARLLRDARLVLCLGNRVALTAYIGHSLDGATRVVGAATTAAEGMALVERHAPTLVVVSDVLEQGDGISLVAAIKTRWPDLQTLLLVSREQRLQRIQTAIAAGCEGVVSAARFGQGAGLAALQAVSGGGVYIDRTLHDAVRRAAGGRGPSEPLTQREREVLTLVARGTSNSAIGQALYISQDTVKTHLSHVMRKLSARDRTHAAVLGVCWDLIDWPEP
jgi:DNA-binding NarL/FixJ family response regulator